MPPTEVPDSNINFPQSEEEILKLWEELDAFQTSLKQSKGKPKFSFYDGPPFATGLPHYGHILAGTIKDIVTRFAHGRGMYVERRFGWDTHGLPVEFEIDKKLGIKGPEDVAKMGIAAYNAECRSIVSKYSSDWERVIGRMGRWIDFKRDYKTMYPWFMESIWWVFQQLYRKGLIYKGFRVMPYSTGCTTPLSNFEAGQNYKDVVDPTVIVTFPLDSEPGVSLVAWTTTPWTLPSNLALCVHPDLGYVRVKDNKTEAVYIMMEARLAELFKKEEDYTVLAKVKGSDLKGLTYKPLFPYFAHMKEQGAFRVLNDTYVTESAGTGVVHQAPYFGEDDNRVCLAAGVIVKGTAEVVCPLDASGCFTDKVTDFAGQYVKAADKHIIKWLKEAGRLVHQGSVKHAYPFCWRSQTPLLQRAVPSWFMRVQQMQQRLLSNNEETYWVPGSIKEGRFANWLRDARDWNISRNRYWGTPIPVWVSEDGEEQVCVGSIDELEQLSGVRLTDLHREHVDLVTIPSSRPGKPPLRRITEVFDCWFESGSMPYAQCHYPFENKREFEDSFPADFIAEGQDQTRGWFYTLLVISTALFDKPPFKNLIVNGLVLASDGQKMSKSKQNYPDPMLVVNKFGADAVRLYLINSPVVKAENLRFKEEGVQGILRDVFLPWYNAFRFLFQNIEMYEREQGVEFSWSEGANAAGRSTNVMDRWIVSFTQSLLLFLAQEMAAYRLYTVIPRLMKFIDNLTNWYVRMNRRRLKGEGGRADCLAALHTLFGVVMTMVRVMAPFTPFLTEKMYQQLRRKVPELAGPASASVHYLMLPTARQDLIDEGIERAVGRMQAVVDLGRVLRDRKTMPIKYPLPEVVVIHKDQQALDDIRSLEQYIKEELNVRAVTLSADKASYGVTLRAEPDHKTLGLRLKGAFKPVMAEIKTLSDSVLTAFLAGGPLEVQGHRLEREDLRIMYQAAAAGSEKYETDSCGDTLIMLDTSPDQAMLDEGVAREVINRVQKLRKSTGLKVADRVTMFYTVQPAGHGLGKIMQEFGDYIQTASKTPLRPLPSPSPAGALGHERYDLKGAELTLTVVKGFPAGYTDGGSPSAGAVPAVPWCNVQLVGVLPAPHCGTSCHGGLLLPSSSNLSTLLPGLVQHLFGLYGVPLDLFLDPAREARLEPTSSLDGKTLFAFKAGQGEGKVAGGGETEGFNCKFVNVMTSGGVTHSVLLENPVGRSAMEEVGESVLGFGSRLTLFADKDRKKVVKLADIEKHAGQMVYL